MNAIMLNSDAILKAFAQRTPSPMHLHLFESIDSTSRFLKDLPRTSDNTLTCCLAEEQTSGRGRFGRHWHSPFGENIYCSIRWHFNKRLDALSGLSLVVGLAVFSVLHNLGLSNDLFIKWPNDLLWQDKKLCGILIDIIKEDVLGVDVIIGIGLNVNTVSPVSPDSSKPWCSLIDITHHHWDRNPLIAQLIDQVMHHLHQFEHEGFSAFLHAWPHVDYLYNQPISVSHHTNIIEGRAEGVNNSGQLLLVDKNGVTHALSSGETSLTYIKKTNFVHRFDI